MSNGLSQFIFLNPQWLVAAVACILRHNLADAIHEVRRQFQSGGDRAVVQKSRFYDLYPTCPVITADDA